MKPPRFLFASTKSSLFDIPMQLIDMGYEVEVMDHYGFDAYTEPPQEQLAPVIEALADRKPDYMITYRFHPVFSRLCMEYGVRYIAWIYDSPCWSVFSKDITNENNRVIIFDRCFCDRLSDMGISHIYHMPLCANVDRVANLELTEEDEKLYSCDISFAGSMYTDNLYNINESILPADLKTDVDKYVSDHMCDWHKKREWPFIDRENCIRLFSRETVEKDERRSTFPVENDYGIRLMSWKLGEMERRRILDVLSRDHVVNFYSGKDLVHGSNIIYHNSINYYTELPKLYYFSKINLNITIPTIETGLPQRIFDIMAAGGFVLTNYQEELTDIFDIGVDLEVFRDIDELTEKVEYYLVHEEERLRIAMNGYQKVRDHHDYKKRLAEVLYLIEE